MLDGIRVDSTVGIVEISRDIEAGPSECVVIFSSRCCCGWEGETRTNEDCTSSEARVAMEAEAAEHMRIEHPSVRVRA